MFALLADSDAGFTGKSRKRKKDKFLYPVAEKYKGAGYASLIFLFPFLEAIRFYSFYGIIRFF